MIEVMLERETANDETATIVAVYATSGQAVEKDEVLFDVENSKATQEVVAPESGVLRHTLKTGDLIDFGVCIATIAPPDLAEAAPPPPAAPSFAIPAREPAMALAAPALEPAMAGRPVFSQAALALIAELGLERDDFQGAFVTSADVSGRLPARQPQAPRADVGRSAPTLPGVPVGGRKQAEITALEGGPGATMLSVVGVTLGPLPVTRQPGHFLEGRITDLVIYEAARLLRKFPRLNAFYADGGVTEHEAVHAGLAIDSGGRLAVYGIADADRMSLPELSGEMAGAIQRYLDGRLTSAELSRATFTVTDLSADELDFVFPLIPRGQSCIIGVTQSKRDGYRLFVGFDHRVSEGREAAAFAGELRERLMSFAIASAPAHAAAACGFCGMLASDAVRKFKYKGLLSVTTPKGDTVLCCGSCWSGW